MKSKLIALAFAATLSACGAAAAQQGPAVAPTSAHSTVATSHSNPCQSLENRVLRSPTSVAPPRAC